MSYSDARVVYSRHPIDIREFGPVGNPAGDDAVLNAALALGQVIQIPDGVHVYGRGNHQLRSGSGLVGPGYLHHIGGSGSALLTTNDQFADDNPDCENVLIQGVKFRSDLDSGFLHFIRLDNVGGTIRNLRILDNDIVYDPPSVGNGDRWFIAHACPAGTMAENLLYAGNTLRGPMQLTSGASRGHYRNVKVLRNVITDHRSNAIAFLSSSGEGDGATFEDFLIAGNSIYGSTDASSIGIAIGLDGGNPDRSVRLIDVRIVDNRIVLEGGGYPIGIFCRYGTDNSSIGGQDSVMDRCIIARNIVQAESALDLSAIGHDQAAEALQKWMVQDNILHGNIHLRRHDGTVFAGNVADTSGRMRLRTGNGTIRMRDNVIRIMSAEAGVTLRSRGDVFVGAGGWHETVVSLDAPAGETIDVRFDNVTIDSPSAGATAIETKGDGASTAVVTDLQTDTAFAELYRETTGSIIASP